MPSAPVRVAIETTFLPLLTQLSLPTTAHHTLPHHTYPLTPPTNHTPTTLRTYVRKTIHLHRQNTTPTTTQPTPTHPSTTNHTTHTHTHTYRFQSCLAGTIGRPFSGSQQNRRCVRSATEIEKRVSRLMAPRCTRNRCVLSTRTPCAYVRTYALRTKFVSAYERHGCMTTSNTRPLTQWASLSLEHDNSLWPNVPSPGRSNAIETPRGTLRIPRTFT